MALDDNPLPQCAQEQNDGEHHVDQLTRYKHDAEGNDDESHHDEGRIYLEGTLNLVAVDTEQQGDEYHAQQPGIFDEQAAGHDEEILLKGGTHHAHHCCEGDGGSGHDDARALLQEFGRVEAFGHEAEGQHVEHDSRHNIEEDEEEELQDDGAVPVRILIAGTVLLFNRGLHLFPSLPDISQQRDVVFAAIFEDTGLDVVVTAVGIVIKVLQTLLSILVDGDIIRHLVTRLL